MRLRKKSRYQKARNAVKQMLPKRRPMARPQETVVEGEKDYKALHWMTAGLFVAAGAEAALGERRGDYRTDAIRWAPFIAAPLAGAVQAARALWPSPTTRVVSQLVNGIALGVGAAGLASSVSDIISEHKYLDDDEHGTVDHVPSLAPLAFGAVGLLALLLDSTDEAEPEPPARPRRRIIIRV
ncbi:MAG TPA: hypothetical protein VF021_09280 [Longimicrobiales bacterium]